MMSLLSLPSGVVSLILQCLPLQDKLIEVTRLTRRLAVLDPSTMRHDHLRMNAAVVGAFASLPSTGRHRLVSGLRSLSFTQSSFSEESAQLQLTQKWLGSSIAAAPFSGMQVLQLTLPAAEVQILQV